MAILDERALYDGWDNLAAGADAGRRPSMIDKSQVAKARDAVFRGGVPKSRPGFRKLEKEFEHELYYNPIGQPIGPSVIVANYTSTVLGSLNAKFTPLDVNSRVTGPGIDVDTFIVTVVSATEVTLSSAVTGSHANTDVTVVSRSTPLTVTDGILAGTSVFSSTINFTSADLGHPIVEVTPTYLPEGTFISQIITPNYARMATPTPPPLSLPPIPDVAFTLPDRIDNISSTNCFNNEPFQGAGYYAPSKNNECIMATLGGRLFQITPKETVAHIREVALGVEPHVVATQTLGDGATTNTDATFNSATANFTGYDIGISITGSGIPADTVIASINSPTSVELSHAATATAGSVTFILHNRISLSGGRNSRNIPLNWMVQADRYHITQDGAAKPIIFDGVIARRAAIDEIPVGKAMAYGIGRLVVTKDRDILFGDLFGSHTGDPANSILKFTETKFFAEGGAANVPYTLGEITAVTFYPSQDTATGQGELVVFTEKGAVSFDLHLPREEWKNTQFQQIALINSTARGHRAIAILNSDLWIRSDEGWRAYRQARSLATGWYQLPQSTEVSPWTQLDTASLLAFGSAINFNNRLIVTSNPVPNQGRLYHAGMLSLDFDVLSSFGQATRPAWDGHWGKLRVLQLVNGSFKGRNRAFAFALDEDDTTQIYEISTDETDDFDGPVTSEIEFRSYDFNSPFNEKNLYGCDIWVDEVRKSTDIVLSFKPDSSCNFLDWKTFDTIYAQGNCGEITCGMVPTTCSGFAPRLRTPKPLEECDDYTSRMIRRGYEFQPKLRWTGHAAIRRMRLKAMQVEEDPKAVC